MSLGLGYQLHAVPAWRELVEHAECRCEQAVELDGHRYLGCLQALNLGQHGHGEGGGEVVDQCVQVLVDQTLVRILRVDIGDMQQAAHAHVFRVGFVRLRCQGDEPLHDLGQGAIRLCQEWPGNGMVAGQEALAQLGNAG